MEMSEEPKVEFKRGRDAESLAIQKLEETLEISLKGRKLTDMHRDLRKRMDEISQKSLQEILYSSDAGATAKVLDIVWDAATPNLMGRQLCVVISRDTSSIKVPKAAVAKVGWIAGVGGVPITEEDYTFTTISAKKSGGRAVISMDMIEDAEWDVVERQLREIARAMADFETETIIAQMIADAGNSATAATSGALAFSDIASMWGTMAKANRSPNALALNPDEFADLLKDSAIQNIVTYRREEFVPGGTIAYIPGIKILVSSKAPAGTALLVDTHHAGILFIRRDITLEEYNDPINDLFHVPATARWNYATIDANAIGKITSA